MLCRTSRNAILCLSLRLFLHLDKAHALTVYSVPSSLPLSKKELEKFATVSTFKYCLANKPKTSIKYAKRCRHLLQVLLHMTPQNCQKSTKNTQLRAPKDFYSQLKETKYNPVPGTPRQNLAVVVKAQQQGTVQEAQCVEEW